MTPQAEIKRRFENYICAKLRLAIPTHTFIPFNGGDEDSDAGFEEPPFTVVLCGELIKEISFESTWTAPVSIQTITHIKEATSPAHAILVHEIYTAVSALTSDETVDGLIVNGIDVMKVRSATSEDNKANADIIDLSCGVSGYDISEAPTFDSTQTTFDSDTLTFDSQP